MCAAIGARTAQPTTLVCSTTRSRRAGSHQRLSGYARAVSIPCRLEATGAGVAPTRCRAILSSARSARGTAAVGPTRQALDKKERHMKGVVFPGNRKLEIMDFPDPAPGPGEVVLEIKA